MLYDIFFTVIIAAEILRTTAIILAVGIFAAFFKHLTRKEL